MKQGVLSSVHMREFSFFALMCAFVLIAQAVVSRIPLLDFANLFVSYAVFLAAFSTQHRYLILFFLVIFILSPLGAYAVPYIASFGAAFILVRVFVRKYFEPGSWYGIVVMSVLYTVSLYGFDWIITHTVYEEARKPFMIYGVLIGILFNAIAVFGISLSAKVTRAFWPR